MNNIDSVLIGLTLIILSAITTDVINDSLWERKAINAGHAEYVTTDVYGNTEWQWKEIK